MTGRKRTLDVCVRKEKNKGVRQHSKCPDILKAGWQGLVARVTVQPGPPITATREPTRRSTRTSQSCCPLWLSTHEWLNQSVLPEHIQT